jgi:hypothetical protein
MTNRRDFLAILGKIAPAAAFIGLAARQSSASLPEDHDKQLDNVVKRLCDEKWSINSRELTTTPHRWSKRLPLSEYVQKSAIQKSAKRWHSPKPVYPKNAVIEIHLKLIALQMSRVLHDPHSVVYDKP